MQIARLPKRQPSVRREATAPPARLKWAPTRPGSVTPSVAVVFGLGALVAILWSFDPAGMTFSAPPLADPVYEEASLRWAMALTSERIDDFVRSRARTPTDFTEIGGQPWETIGYERISNHRYRLTAPSSRGPIVFDSIRRREDFAGESRETLQRGSARAKP